MKMRRVVSQHGRIVEFIDGEFGLLPEGRGGLSSLLEAEEDFTCFTMKKMLGRRDKSWGSHV